MTCDHGMPNPAACTECMMEGPLPAAPKDDIRIAYVFRAKFTSKCHHCGDEMREAEDTVARLTDDSYVHANPCAIEACR